MRTGARAGGLPPVRCHATAKRTKQPCRQWAMVGSTVCHKHGGATRAARAKADQRMSLAQLLRGDPRPPWQVLLEALNASDALMQDGLEAVVKAGDQVTPDQLDRFVSSLERAAKLSKMTLDANIGERRTRMLEREGELLAGAVSAGLEALFAQLALEPARELELRQVALDAAAERLDTTDVESDPGRDRNNRLTRNVAGIRRIRRTGAEQAEADRAGQGGDQLELLPPAPSTSPSPAPDPGSRHPSVQPRLGLVPEPPRSPLEG